MPKDYYSLGEIAELISVKPYQIQYAISTGQLPEPSKRISGRRVFTDIDLRKCKTFFDSKTGMKRSNEVGDEEE